jgi:hypothetical protein
MCSCTQPDGKSFKVPDDTICLACIAPAPPKPAPGTPVPTAAPTGPSSKPTPSPSPAPSQATPGNAAKSSKSSSATTGAIVGSICGVLVLGGIGYYFYSQKQALAKQAAENAVTGLDSTNKI